MEAGFGFIVLRDVPKDEARIDLDTYNIEGGFRGFQLVPAGVHYTSVQVQGTHKGFWCYLQPNEVLVKVFNASLQQFQDDEPETMARYQQLALGGAMDQALISYARDSYLLWQELTNQISFSSFPPTLFQEEPKLPPNLSSEELGNWVLHQKSRFEQALFDTHTGNISALLTEFQFAFVRWFIDDEDMEAFNRWRYLLQAFYNAGESSIAKNPDFFLSLIDILLTQFDCLPEEMFADDSFLVSQAEYLAEDMIDSDIENLVEKGQEFKDYLEEREVA